MNPTEHTYKPHEIDQLTVEAMVDLLDIRTTRETYLYLDQEGHLSAIEKPHADTSPGDEGYAIGYVRKLRGG